jgi:hypothetical protein
VYISVFILGTISKVYGFITILVYIWVNIVVITVFIEYTYECTPVEVIRNPCNSSILIKRVYFIVSYERNVRYSLNIDI